MKRIILFAIALLPILNSHLCVAQNTHKLDSLLIVIATAKADTTRFYAYAGIIQEYAQVNNFEKAKAYSDTALQIGEKLSALKEQSISQIIRIGMAKSYLGIASIYYYQYQFPSADSAYYKALSYVEGESYTSRDEKLLAAKIYHNIGSSCLSQEKLDSAILLFQKSLDFEGKINYQPGMANNYISLGNAYNAKSDFPKALEYYLKCLSIATETNDSELLFSVYDNIGMNYYYQNDFNKALDYHLKCLKIAEQIHDKPSIFTSYNNLGITYNDLRNYPKALDYYSKALTVASELGDKFNMLKIYNNIGTVYADISRLPIDSINELRKNWTFPAHGNIQSALLDSAIANHTRSLALSVEINNDQGKIFNLKGMGVAYADKKEYDKGIYYSKQAAEIAEQIGHSRDLMYISQDMVWSYVKKGDYKNAYLWSEKYYAIKDSIYGEEEQREVGRQEQKYESEKQVALLTKDKQIQDAEIKRQKLIKNYFIGGFGALLLVIILFYNNYRTKQLLKLQTLRNQIASDLHDDIGSTLTSISIFSELAKEQSKEVIPMLENIGESSRKMLESMADIVWTINPENDNFEKIIWRMRSFAYELLRAKNIDFEFTADETVSRMKITMEVRKNLYLIFKEAINNMVKYAGADRAFFNISSANNQLTMLIRDNGKGFDINEPLQGNGIRNMKKRAEEIGAKLLIESGKGLGTTIQFLLKTA